MTSLPVKNKCTNQHGSTSKGAARAKASGGRAYPCGSRGGLDERAGDGLRLALRALGDRSGLRLALRALGDRSGLRLRLSLRAGDLKGNHKSRGCARVHACVRVRMCCACVCVGVCVLTCECARV